MLWSHNELPGNEKEQGTHTSNMDKPQKYAESKKADTKSTDKMKF